MTAETPTRRSVTAQEGAEALGCSSRTVRRIAAEPRDEFIKRSRARQDLALELKKAGLKYREIATVLRLSPETVKVHLFQARKRLQEELGDYFRDAYPEEAAS